MRNGDFGQPMRMQLQEIMFVTCLPLLGLYYALLSSQDDDIMTRSRSNTVEPKYLSRQTTTTQHQGLF